MKYEDELWGKTEFLHERYKKKHLYVSNFIEIINKFLNACLNFSKSLILISNKNYQLLEEKNNSIYDTVQNILSFIALQSQEYNELYNNIKSNILEPTTKLLEELNHKEKELYTLYLKSRTQYQNFRSSLEKAQKDYENSIKICEKAIYNAKTMETNPLASEEEKDRNANKANTFITSSKTLEDKYFNSIEEANKLRTNEYNKQKELLVFYQKIDNDNYNKIKGMVGVFLVFIKKMYKSIFSSIETISDNYQNINIIKDLNTFMKNNKSDNKPDDPITFIPYCPEASLETTSISGDQKENEKLRINYEVISTLRKSFRNICEGLNMEEETKKHRLRLLTLKIFKIGPNVTFSQNEKDELISYLKIPEYRTYFIIHLSKQRTKGRFQRGEKLLNDLAEILEIILDISEKEKNYEEAKNCIILSQTFYTEITLNKNRKKEKYKRYLFDYIIDNKWLSSTPFWEGIIDFMIQKEIEKNEEIIKVENSKETLEERRLRISNISFSQLLSYTNNMLEFDIKKDIIKTLVDLFVKKYDIEKNMANIIYDNIDNSPEKPKIIPIKKKNKKIKTNKIAKAKSLKNKDYFLKLDFEIIEKNDKRKINSFTKYKTKIKLEENKFKLQRKNELSKKFKKYNFDEEEEDSEISSKYSKQTSSNIMEDSLDIFRKKSYETEKSDLGKKFNNNLNFTTTMSFDISNIKMNLDEDPKIEEESNKKTENNNFNKIIDKIEINSKKTNNNENKTNENYINININKNNNINIINNEENNNSLRKIDYDNINNNLIINHTNISNNNTPNIEENKINNDKINDNLNLSEENKTKEINEQNNDIR